VIKFFRKKKYNWTPISEHKFENVDYPSTNLKTNPIDPLEVEKISYPVMAHIYKKLQEKGKITVIDFGGSNAQYYSQFKKFAGSEALNVKWLVVETKSYVDSIEAKQFENVKHFTCLDDAIKFNGGRADILLASSVVQYISKSLYKKLVNIAKEVDLFILDRVAICRKAKKKYKDNLGSLLTIQKDIGFPCIFLSENYIINSLRGFSLVDSFDSVFDHQKRINKKVGICFKGYIFENAN